MGDSPSDSIDTLRERARQLATLLSNLPGMAYRGSVDPEWPMEFVSEGCLSLTGYRPEELVRGEPSYGQLLDPEDREPVWRYVLAAIDRGQPFTLTYRITTSSGHRRWVWEQGRAVRGDAGRIEAIEGFVTDITERRSAEDRLRRSNRLYAVLSRINEAIVRIRHPSSLLEEVCRIAVDEGRFRLAWVALRDAASAGRFQLAASYGDKDGLLASVLADKQYLEETEGHVARCVGRGRRVIIPRLELEVAPEPWREALLARDLLTVASFPLFVSNRIAGSFNLYSDPTPLDDEEVRLLESLTADLSFALECNQEEHHRRRLQADLVRARSIETMGRLAGTLAHDFNNILMIVSASAESLRRHIDDSAPGLKEIDQIQQACTRGSSLTRRLLTFGKKQESPVRRLDLGGLVRESKSLLSQVLGESISLVIDVQAGDHPVISDVAQLEQLLLNLTLNARDAMPHGGKIFITVDSIEAKHPDALEGDPEGPHVRLVVEDTGPGLSPEVRERMFEPFFSTKAAAAGSGLGLAIAADVAGRAGGWILAPEQSAGDGARFEILLPRATA